MSYSRRRGGGGGGGGGGVAAAAAVACTSRYHDTRERINPRECRYGNEIEERLPSGYDALFVTANNDRRTEEKEEEEVATEVVGKRDRRNVAKNETWAANGRCDDVVGASVTEKFSVDFEKWFKTRSESDLDAKVVEDVDRYLGEEVELSPHGFLGKDPYGLSIDIDLATDKKEGLNLTGYDPILQDELPSEKLLEESCEKVDDEYILSDFQLYPLDPLALSPDDMMVAGEILPSTSGQSTLSVGENQSQENAENRVRAVLRMEQRSCSEVSCEKPAQITISELDMDPVIIKPEKEEVEEVQNEMQLQQEAVTSVQSSGNPSDLFMEVLAPIEESPSNSVAEANVSHLPGIMVEQLKPKTRIKLQPRIIKKRRKTIERLEKRFDKHVNNGFVSDNGVSQQDDVMAVVAISTDKTSNTTQIVINTGTERQVYQGKTSELIEATGNFPMLPKIDTSAAIWNGIPTVDCNGFDTGNPNSNQYEIVISKALEELGITDDSLQPVCITEHDKIWLCPRDDCNKQFGRLYTLKGHLLGHYGVRPFKCDFEGCTWAFYSEFKLKRHKKTHLKRKDHVCKVEGCNRRFTTIYNLWSHAKLHSRPNRIACQVPDCDEKFQTKRALELHMKSHDQRHAPYVCQHEGCGKRYYSSNALTSHQRSHSYKEVDVKCSWPGCGKVFDKPCRLKAHTRSHTGCKPYHCTYEDCKWAFSSSSKLKRHQKKHTNERKFACDVPGCGKAFMRSEHLKEHRLTHTEGRYFHCFMCDARFSAKSSLYVHIKKHQIKATGEPTNVVDDILNGMSGKKRTKMKESHYTRVKSIKPNRRSKESIRSEERESDAVSRGDVERQPGVQHELARIQDPTIGLHMDQLRTVYYCPIETCTYLYTSEASLRQHALKTHGVVIVQCDDNDDNNSLERGPSSDAVTDYVLYTLPPSSSTNSSAATAAVNEQMIMVMADDTRIVDHSASSSSSPSATDTCLPEPELPSSFGNAVLPKSTQPTRGDKLRAMQEVPIAIKNKDQGSARTDLTLSDVLRFKVDDTRTDTNRSIATSHTSLSDAVTLGANDLCESLLLMEELPSMYYQDDAAGAEYQVLLLDSGPLGSIGNLRGFE